MASETRTTTDHDEIVVADDNDPSVVARHRKVVPVEACLRLLDGPQLDSGARQYVS